MRPFFEYFRLPLARNATANVIQMSIGALLLFALFRLINDKLGVEQLGIWSVVLATASASRLAELGLSASVIRFVARDKSQGDQSRAGCVVDTTAITLAITVALLLPIVGFVAYKILPSIFQTENLKLAWRVLPIALVSLWLTIVGSVFQGGLDGYQRMELRAALVLFGKLLLYILAVFFVPMYGLAGLAWAQVGQGIFLLIGARLLLCRLIPSLSWLPRGWRWSVLHEMLKYAVNIQISTIFVLLLDPVAKAFMARFGGVAAAGYFEMANQVVIRARSVIVSGNQAAVPHVSEWKATSPDKVVAFYRKNICLLLFVALPVTGLLVTASPLISHLLIGDYQVMFVSMLSILSITWGINVMAGPAYFINMGTGHVGFNTISHAATSVLSVILGLSLGSSFGLVGVFLGYVLGIIFGTLLLIVMFRVKYQIPYGLSRWREFRIMIGLFAASISWTVYSLNDHSLQGYKVSSISLLCAIIFFGVSSWNHMIRKEIIKW